MWSTIYYNSTTPRREVSLLGRIEIRQTSSPSIRVHEAVLDFSDCPDDMWKPALQRFKLFVTANHNFSDADSNASPTREDSREKTKKDKESPMLSLRPKSWIHYKRT